jgi:ankyrin repeat protein
MRKRRKIAIAMTTGACSLGLALFLLSRSQTVFLWAIRNRHINVAQWMANHGAFDRMSEMVGETPLMRAAFRNDIQTVERLIRQGADVNARSPEGETALQLAIAAQRDGVVGMLVAKGADPNIIEIGGGRPVIQAASLGRADYVTLLLAAGADVNAKDGQGDTALTWACQGAGLATVQVLVHYGADLNAVDRPSGRTPLMCAAQACAPDVVVFLLDAGAKTGMVDANGETAMFWAAIQDRPENIKVLASRGLDVNARNKYGSTPLMSIANSSGRVRAAKALIECGADIRALTPSGLTARQLREQSGVQGKSQMDMLELLSRAEAAAQPPITK